jgi:hypothetical protein
MILLVVCLARSETQASKKRRWILLIWPWNKHPGNLQYYNKSNILFEVLVSVQYSILLVIKEDLVQTVFRALSDQTVTLKTFVCVNHSSLFIFPCAIQQNNIVCFNSSLQKGYQKP